MALKKTKETGVSQSDKLILNLQNFIAKEKTHEAELSRQTGIPQPTLHKILTGKTTDPRISTLQTLANYFNASLGDLYSDHLLQRNDNVLKGKSIPIISWIECIKFRETIKNILSNHWEQWVVVSDNNNEQMFALKSKASIEPRFPRGTIFIVDPETRPIDGDLVVVHYSETKEATMRELSIDGRAELLLPLHENSKPDRLSKLIKLIGVVVQSRFSYQDATN